MVSKSKIISFVLFCSFAISGCTPVSESPELQSAAEVEVEESEEPGLDQELLDKLKAEEEAAYLEKILEERKSTDYCENFYMQLRMVSLESFYQRAQKEHGDFLRYFGLSNPEK